MKTIRLKQQPVLFRTNPHGAQALRPLEAPSALDQLLPIGSQLFCLTSNAGEEVGYQINMTGEEIDSLCQQWIAHCRKQETVLLEARVAGTAPAPTAEAIQRADDLRHERTWLLQHGVEEKIKRHDRTYSKANLQVTAEVAQLTNEINNLEGRA